MTDTLRSLRMQRGCADFQEPIAAFVERRRPVFEDG